MTQPIGKFVSFTLLFGLISTLGGCLLDSELISEVRELREPVRDEIIDVGNIVEKYVRAGSTREQVRIALAGQGLDVKDFDKNGIEGFQDCDSQVLLGTFEFLAIPFPIPVTRLVVLVCFEDGLSVATNAVYVRSIL